MNARDRSHVMNVVEPIAFSFAYFRICLFYKTYFTSRSDFCVIKDKLHWQNFTITLLKSKNIVLINDIYKLYDTDTLDLMVSRLNVKVYYRAE